ncbi:hypothetical protein DSO57_1038677 [Entomophthora muscae]|uniref:Uncharacterized protein n=1 Tax=Entomophthora muscae TaxID=34485 RepID=A0ACC2UJU6_9FUNG|nr:hypothetical protein DSO57_1038677 [Entomophthora muscae]
MQAKYKLLTNHLPLLENDKSSKPVPGYNPGHTLGTGDQEPHTPLIPTLNLMTTNLTSSMWKITNLNGPKKPNSATADTAKTPSSQVQK